MAVQTRVAVLREAPGSLADEPERLARFADRLTVRLASLENTLPGSGFAVLDHEFRWLEAPPALGRIVENLVQYSTSGVAAATQRAAAAAIELGEHFVSTQIARMRESRDILCAALAATGRVRFAVPRGSFYLFCAIEGMADSREAALRLVGEANVGVAPGSAFGAGGAPFLRLCFARDPRDIARAADRLTRWLS